jgi:hypothetical protein
MKNFNFTDFYIGYPGHPRFRNSEIIEDDVIRVIIQKYEMILFTNKGDVFGDLDFGLDLEELLFETKLSAESIESMIRVQINKYVGEISSINYTVNVSFFEDPDRYQDYMEILFNIKDYEVYTIVG